MNAIQFIEHTDTEADAKTMFAFLGGQVGYLGGRILRPSPNGWWEHTGESWKKVKPVWRVQVFFTADDVPAESWLPAGTGTSRSRTVNARFSESRSPMQRNHIWISVTFLVGLAAPIMATVLATPHGWKFILGIPLGLIFHHRAQYNLARSSADAKRRRAIRETYRRKEQ